MPVSKIEMPLCAAAECMYVRKEENNVYFREEEKEEEVCS